MLEDDVVGELTERETEEVLRSNIVGRIGAHAFGKTYVVPITYVYDGSAVYAHTRDGMKLHMMRENPHVCFEVDRMDGLANWTSVIAWGTFEELHGDRAGTALKMLVEVKSQICCKFGSRRLNGYAALVFSLVG
jgi:nitroimidazol reductase NimA-like FMN-containing flavoprotein (pyridoxamine 5'-phosphate oxidase superfamily)